MVVGIERVAEAELAVSLLQPLLHVVVDARVDNQPPRAGAALPGGTDRPEHNGRNRDRHIGPRRDDDGIVTAQFQQAFAQSSPYGFGYGLAHAGTARGRHQGNPSVVGDPLAHVASAHDQARDAFGYFIGFQYVTDDILAGDGGKGRFLGGLPDAHIAADPGNHGVP